MQGGVSSKCAGLRDQPAKLRPLSLAIYPQVCLPATPDNAREECAEARRMMDQAEAYLSRAEGHLRRARVTLAACVVLCLVGVLLAVSS